MRKITKVSLPFLLIISLLCSCSQAPAGTAARGTASQQASLQTSAQPVTVDEDIIRELTAVEPYSEGDRFPIKEMGNIVLVFTPEGERVQATIEYAVELFNTSHALATKAGWFSNIYGKHTGDVVLIEDNSLANEEYKRIITKSNIYIYYNSTGNCNGLLYGLQDVLKLCMSSPDGTLPCGESRFLPDTKERVLMLDCARKCWSVDWIKNLIREMSWMGFNALELHLTEDQGIRADIWRDKNGQPVPDCNGNDFSFLCGGTVVSWNEDYHEKLSASYSRDDLIEILRVANYLHIDIIPSVDFPGHSKNLVVRCEEEAQNGLSFCYNGQTYRASSNEKIGADGSGSNTVDISSAFARNLSFAVTEAYASFFRDYGCDRFDIASDEVSVDDSAWADYATVNGGETMFDGYVIYVNTLCDILKDMGYTVRANNDFLYSQKSDIPIDKDLQICYWKPTDSYYGSAEYLVNEGRTVFNCVESYCYYVLRQSKSGYDARSPQCGWWDFHHSTARRVFSGCGGQCGYSSCNEPGGWNPSKMWGFDGHNKAKVTGQSLGGGYMYIWGDWAGWDTEENVFYRQDDFSLVRRMWAISAKMLDWDADEAMTWDGFEEYIDPIEYSPLIRK